MPLRAFAAPATPAFRVKGSAPRRIKPDLRPHRDAIRAASLAPGRQAGGGPQTRAGNAPIGDRPAFFLPGCFGCCAGSKPIPIQLWQFSGRAAVRPCPDGEPPRCWIEPLVTGKWHEFPGCPFHSRPPDRGAGDSPADAGAATVAGAPAHVVALARATEKSAP